MSLPAQQYAIMKGMLRGALSGNYPSVANPSDQEVLGFLKQVFADASGVAALSAVKQAAMSLAFLGALSGNSNLAANPNSADVATFIGQLATDSASASTLSASRYAALRSVLRAVLSQNYPGASNPSETDVLGFFGAFAAASPLTIFLTTPPILWVRADLGVTGSPVTALADQSGAGHNMTSGAGPTPTASDATLNNLQTLGMTFGTVLQSGAISIAPPYTYLLIAKPTTWNSGVDLVGDAVTPRSGNICYAGGAGGIYQDSGNFVNNSAPTFGNWYRFRAKFANATTDELKIGSAAPVTGAASGPNVPGTIGLNVQNNSGVFQFYELVVLPGDATAGEYSAYDAYITARTAGACQV